MLNKDDKKKIAIMKAIRGGWTDDRILDEFHLSSGTLTAYKSEYEMIKAHFDNMGSASEIANSLDCSEEFIEEARSVIQTGEETLQNEGEDDGKTPQKTGKKGGKARNIDRNLKSTGEEQTASVLVDDAGEIARGVAIQRQDIGKFVTEVMGTVAMQFGYKDVKEFLKDNVFDFWLKNQGRVREMEALIEELTNINQELQEALELDMVGLFIAKSIDRVTIASLIGGGDLDIDKLHVYKQMLLTDPAIIRQLYEAVHNLPANLNEDEEEVYATQI